MSPYGDPPEMQLGERLRSLPRDGTDSIGATVEETDEALMHRLAAGEQEALGPLYSRYAPLIFSLAAQSLDRLGAEEIVQDVLLAVWRRADTFDAGRGAFRPWVLQIARYRIVNELRRRSRRPVAVAGDPAGELEALADTSPEPSEAAWREYRSSVLQSAFAALPPNQRTALGLAFFEELTHEQVASVLGVALGTAKSRIRSGLHQLRGKIGYLVAAVAIVASLGVVTAREVSEQARVARQERAIALLTSSETLVLRATAQPGAPEAAHATYRGQPGSPMAIVTVSYMPPLPAGRVYQVWARFGTRWVSLGTLTPDASGSGRLIAEDPVFSTVPSGLEVTVEPEGGSGVPSTPPVVLLSGS